MKASTRPLAIAPDTAVDFQLHTTNSDGTWAPEQLIDYLVSEGFGLAAITDHDRLDTIAAVTEMAAQKGLPLLPALEITAAWKGQSTDLLCFGIDPANAALDEVVQTIARRQHENTRGVFENLRQKGITFPEEDALQAVLDAPSSSHLGRLSKLLKKHGHGDHHDVRWHLIREAGGEFSSIDVAPAVDAVHQAGGVCLIAHPGRGGNNLKYDLELLDEFRKTIPIDGIEAHYPQHSPEQTAAFVAYAEQHDLLTSSGSDSHGPDGHLPIKYRAELSRRLLERCGIEV